jgi:hypothetical protein
MSALVEMTPLLTVSQQRLALRSQNGNQYSTAPKLVSALHPHSVFLSQRLASNSSGMSMFPDINSMDARRSTFHIVGRDQFNADQMNFHINKQTGAMQCYSCAFTVHIACL